MVWKRLYNMPIRFWRGVCYTSGIWASTMLGTEQGAQGEQEHVSFK